MAQVAPDVKTDVDWLLDYLDQKWRVIPDLARTWDTLDPIDQEVFVLEWAIPHSHLLRLQEYIAHGQLSPAQLARYESLQRLIQAHGPTLGRLMAD
jgi:hypothetical protein